MMRISKTSAALAVAAAAGIFILATGLSWPLPAAVFGTDVPTEAFGLVVAQALSFGAFVGLVLLVAGFVSELAVMIAGALLCFALLLDARLYDVMGVHLYSSFIVESLANPGVFKEVRPSAATILSMLAVVFVAFGCLVVWRAVQKRWLPVESWRRPVLKGLVVLVAALLTGYAAGTHCYARLPTAQGAVLGDALPLFSALHGVYAPQEPLTIDYPESSDLIVSRRQSVIMILVESLRADAFNAQLMPKTTAFVARHDCFVSPRHYANSHTTVYGTFAYLNGLGSHHFGTMRDLQRAPLPLQVLRRNGYVLKGVSASQLRHWQDAGFMLGPFSSYREFTEHSSTAELYKNDEAMVAAFPDDLAVATQPYLHFAFFVSSHWNYSYPPAFEIDRPAAPAEINAFADDLDDEGARQAIRNRYRNAIRFVDDGIDRLLSAHAADIEAGRVAVVIAGDHGEEFWENGTHGHGATRFFDARIRTPLIMCLPGAKIQGVSLSAHTDVMPTLLDYLGVPRTQLAPLFDGVSLIEPGATTNRDIIVTGAGFPETSRKLAVINQHGKFIFQKVTPRLDGLRCEEAWSASDVPTSLPRPSAAVVGKALTRFLRPASR